NAGQAVQEGRLTRSRRSHDGHGLTAGDVDIDTGQSTDVTERLGQSAGAQIRAVRVLVHVTISSLVAPSPNGVSTLTGVELGPPAFCSGVDTVEVMTPSIKPTLAPGHLFWLQIGLGVVGGVGAVVVLMGLARSGTPVAAALLL